MKVININLNELRNEIVGDITIKPLADLHIGSKQVDIKKIKETIKEIETEKNTYTILNGDIMNVNLKNSVGDVYNEELSPMEQLTRATELLRPIKDKILVIASGNHEDRIKKETDIDILRLVARELGVEDRYTNGMWYLFLSFGKESKRPSIINPIQYQITGYHGSGGGRKSGSKINKLEELSQITIADLYVMSHTHKPIATKGIIYLPVPQQKTIVKKEQHYLMTNSFLEYGGYAEKMALTPSNTNMTEAILSSTEKKIKLIL